MLVTGGAGFIGANLVRALASSDDEVRVFDDLSTGNGAYLDGVNAELVRGSVTDPGGVKAAVSGCDAIVHLAAHTSVIDSLAHPLKDFEINAGGTLRLLEAAVPAGVKAFVFASSNAALGEQEPPLHEDQVPRPLSPYGAGKLAGEAYCSAFAGSFGIRCAMLRFSNAYGPFMHGKDSVIPRFIRAGLAGQDLVIFGDGSQTRDFVHVSDLVAGIVAALRSASGKGIFQIATGLETSIADLAEVIVRETGSRSRIRFEERRAGEIHRNQSDISKARAVLGFSPQTTLEEGLRTTVIWFRNAGKSRD